jgi:hypothetical protein
MDNSYIVDTCCSLVYTSSMRLGWSQPGRKESTGGVRGNHRHTWARAMRRAAVRGIAPTRHCHTRQGTSEIRRYWVDSGSRDGIRHSVLIVLTANGIRLECTCEGAMRGNIYLLVRWRGADGRGLDPGGTGVGG